jgi:hypothetical protein
VFYTLAVEEESLRSTGKQRRMHGSEDSGTNLTGGGRRWNKLQASSNWHAGQLLTWLPVYAPSGSSWVLAKSQTARLIETAAATCGESFKRFSIMGCDAFSALQLTNCRHGILTDVKVFAGGTTRSTEPLHWHA